MDINEIEKWHPKLVGENRKIIKTDENLDDFNCIAFTLEIYHSWAGSSTKIWHNPINRYPTLENYIDFYKTYGYEICNNSNYEDNYEKIAIYKDIDNYIGHAAKQFGYMWRSKLGGSYIIEHKLDWLCGFDSYNYGEVSTIMKRKKI